MAALGNLEVVIRVEPNESDDELVENLCKACFRLDYAGFTEKDDEFAYRSYFEAKHRLSMRLADLRNGVTEYIKTKTTDNAS
jgi:hypothetical protein